MVNIIVTGGSGFIGIPMVKKFLASGHEITSLSRTPPAIQHPRLHWVEVNLNNETSTQLAISNLRADLLVHNAWQGIPNFSSEICQRNLNMGQRVISSAIKTAKVKRVVITGSCLEYGRKFGACRESSVSKASDYFTWAKLALLKWAEIYTKDSGIELVWARIFYAYGPNQRSQSLLPTLISGLKCGKMPLINTPTRMNDFIYVDDVAEALEALVSARSIRGVFNVGSGVSISIKDICHMLDRTINGSTEIFNEHFSDNDLKPDVNFWADTSKTRNYLGWFAKTSMEQGIQKMVHADDKK